MHSYVNGTYTYPYALPAEGHITLTVIALEQGIISTDYYTGQNFNTLAKSGVNESAIKFNWKQGLVGVSLFINLYSKQELLIIEA